MTTRATSTFTIDIWDAQPYDERGGVALSRTRVSKTFRGELEGESTAELLMAVAPHGSAAYVGFERVSGRLHGRAGSFVLHHTASAARGEQSASWTIVPDTGTGALAGIRGEARISGEPGAPHICVLEYDLD